MFRFNWIGASEVSPAMFKNPIVDFFSRTPWVAVPVIYVPLITYFLWCALARGFPLIVPMEFTLGVAAWTLTEYWLHRTVFHWKPDNSWGAMFHFLVHGVHHEYHQDPYRLVMPPAASLSLGVVIMLALHGAAIIVSGFVPMGWEYGFFSGMMAGYVWYDMTHYYIHHGRPQHAFVLALKAHHNAHHHNPKYVDKKFGVSSTVWDHVFGTY